MFLCISHVFYFLSSDTLILGDCPSQFLEGANHLPASVPFIYKPTDVEPTPQPPPLWGSHTPSLPQSLQGQGPAN